MEKIVRVFLVITMLFLASGCVNQPDKNGDLSDKLSKDEKETETENTKDAEEKDTDEENTDKDLIGMANPASVNCDKLGGEIEMKEGPGGTYGICFFEDNRQCEEWALLRGECPEGGVKVTGYDTDEEVYCAITGGEVNMDNETCTTPEGKECSLKEFFNLSCPNDTSVENLDRSMTVTEITEETDVWTINAAVPFINNEKIDPKLNEFMKNEVGIFKKDNEAYTVADLFDNMKYTLDISYEIIPYNENIESFEFDIQTYQGGAHGNLEVKTLTFNLTTGEQIMIEDLFKKDSDWIQTLSDIAVADILERDLGFDEELVNMGAGPDKINFEKFALDYDTLYLYYPPYYVAPYAAGLQVVEIPLTDIADITSDILN
jgi:putative hemolysin